MEHNLEILSIKLNQKYENTNFLENIRDYFAVVNINWCTFFFLKKGKKMNFKMSKYTFNQYTKTDLNMFEIVSEYYESFFIYWTKI